MIRLSMPVRLAVLLHLALQFPVQAASAYTVKTLPNPAATAGTYLANPDGILTQAEAAVVGQKLAELEQATTAEVAVAAVNSIGPADPKEFATALFNHWGIGKKGKDNGLLLLVVLDQRAWEIETGYGLEGTLPDAVCAQIGREELAPRFRQGKYGEGIDAAVTRIAAVITAQQGRAPAAGSRNAPRASAPSAAPDAFTKKNPLDYFAIILVAAIYLLGSAVGAVFIAGHVRRVIRANTDPYDAYKKIEGLTSMGAVVGLGFGLLLGGIVLGVWMRGKRRALRRMPRVSRVNGKPMRLLSEQEEDRYLNRGQQVEERLRSRDYDVWVTDNGDDVMVLSYGGWATGITKCSACGFLTDRHVNTVTLVHATTAHAGTGQRNYRCENCGHHHSVTFTIPRVSSSSSSGGLSGGGGGRSFGGGRSGGGGAGGRW